jgi:membrane protein YqaA with SNARE-associated domain
VVIDPILQRRLMQPVPLLLVGTMLPALICSLILWQYFHQWWQLSVFFWYSIPGNSFLWLPHEPAVVYAGAIYSPVLVALVGGFATMFASIIDHALFTRAFQIDRVAAIKKTWIMRYTTNLFNRAPWWTVVFFALTPVPFYPIRLVAPMANYSMFGYVSAVLVGRIPRYFLLAMVVPGRIN